MTSTGDFLRNAWLFSPDTLPDREPLDEQDGGYGVSIESASPGQKSRRDVGITWRRLGAQPLGQFQTIHADKTERYTVNGGVQHDGTREGSTRWALGEVWLAPQWRRRHVGRGGP